MGFVEEDPAERRQHRAYHDEVVNGVKAVPTKAEQVVWQQGIDRIVLVTSNSPRAERIRARKVGRVANKEMRYDGGVFNESDPPDSRDVHLFVSCRNDRGIGLAIFERRTGVCRYTWEEVERGVSKDLVEQEPIWSLGFVWVHHQHRQQGLARHLFQTAVAHLRVPTYQVGFCVPFSNAGKAFARSLYPGGFLIGK